MSSNESNTATTAATSAATELDQLPQGQLLNDEGPAMPQEMRDRLLVKVDASISQIRSKLYKKESKIRRSFDRSSLTVWEYSPHQPLSNSLEYLHEQMNRLREFVKQGSWVGVMLLAPVIRENWTISFARVDEALKLPRYNVRDEQKKLQAQQFYINQWKLQQRGSR
jgi:hypothetical protein